MQNDEATRILRTYGLDVIATTEDDPLLWAAALTRYWPRPHDPLIRLWGDTTAWRVSSLRFGVGLPAPDAPGGIQITHQWCFERIGANSLRVIPYQERTPSFENPWIGLDITRPSQNEAQALIHRWTFHHARAAHGQAYLWARASTGDWTEVETLSEWMA